VIRPVAAGVIALLLGLWTGCGGCFSALGSLAPAGGEPPPWVSGNAAHAAAELSLSLNAYTPVDGAVGALAALTGFALIVAGSLNLARVLPSLVLRAALILSALLDALQLLWALIWLALASGPLWAYAEVVVLDVDANAPIEVVVGFALTLVAVMIALYYAVKITVAIGGAWLARDRAVPSAAEGLGWAD
jgi:hypothetical protein